MMQLSLSDEPAPYSYKRKALDRYDSPLWFGTTLLEKVPISGSILECCSGGGQISEVLRSYKKITNLITNDIDISTEADFHLDATSLNSWHRLCSLDEIDWVITNPPYNAAFEITKLALFNAKKGVAMALRETWLGSSEERLIWLEANKPTDVISMPRFHFARDKNGKWNCDSSAVWWIVWRKDCWGSATNFHFASQQSIKYFYLNPDKAIGLETVQAYVSTLGD